MPRIHLIVSILAGAAFCLIAGTGWSQVVGQEAELSRLQAKAEEAVANDDPDGAALTMGRAALLAKQLSKANKQDVAISTIYQGAEPLFRSQEHGYRAMALFRRAGGQLPASSGVCGSLALAQSSVQQAIATLVQVSEGNVPPPVAERANSLRSTADDWVIVVASMITDYQCP